jgi:hypothetical protein
MVRVPRWLREWKSSMMDLRQPWWPYAMTEFVESVLPPDARVFEYGGGGSSAWLSDHGVRLTVIEHHQEWCEELRRVLPNTVEVISAPACGVGAIGSSAVAGYFDDYVKAIDSYPDRSFDLVIIDGRARVECVARAKAKVKQGGHLLLDDSDRSRYSAAITAMSAWQVKTITGLKPGSPIPATTTIWTKP